MTECFGSRHRTNSVKGYFLLSEIYSIGSSELTIFYSLKEINTYWSEKKILW